MSFSPINWIRDALGIRKDIIETRKAQAELRKLDDEEIARRLLMKATLEDVLKYDRNTRKLLEKVAEELNNPPFDPNVLHSRSRLPDISYCTIYHNIERFIYWRQIAEEQRRYRDEERNRANKTLLRQD